MKRYTRKEAYELGRAQAYKGASYSLVLAMIESGQLGMFKAGLEAGHEDLAQDRRDRAIDRGRED